MVWGKDLHWRMQQRLKLLTMTLLTLTDWFSCVLPRHPWKFTAGNFLWMLHSLHFSLTQHLPPLCLISLSCIFLLSPVFLFTNPTSSSKEITTTTWCFSLIYMTTPAFRTSAFLGAHLHHWRKWSSFWKADGDKLTTAKEDMTNCYRKLAEWVLKNQKKPSIVKKLICIKDKRKEEHYTAL